MYVRFGSKADITRAVRNVRFTPESGHRDQPLECPLLAITGHWRIVRNSGNLAYRDAGSANRPPHQSRSAAVYGAGIGHGQRVVGRPFHQAGVLDEFLALLLSTRPHFCRSTISMAFIAARHGTDCASLEATDGPCPVQANLLIQSRGERCSQSNTTKRAWIAHCFWTGA